MDILSVIGRKTEIFSEDLKHYEEQLNDIISGSKILVIGAAGSIGQAVTIELFKRDPKLLHVVDLSENNMVELVRSARSTVGYGSGDFRTFALDCGSEEFEALFNAEGPYDYIFNLSAMKHVRSEKDPFTLMRLIRTNIFNTISTLKIGKQKSLKNYFCVSTDKAANPVNMMGASKRIMEQFLMRESLTQSISMARFANVAFSDGSLLHGFNQRFAKKQPITAPNDVRRYFVTPQESGQLCMLSGLFGQNRDIFFPKLAQNLYLEKFTNIAIRFLESHGYEAWECSNEEEARGRADELIKEKKWPVYFFESDTTGEKDFEEFFTNKEKLELESFLNIGIIKNYAGFDDLKLNFFNEEIKKMLLIGSWNKTDLVCLFNEMIPEFDHKETGKYLDNRM